MRISKYGTNHEASRVTIYANRLGREKLVETQFFWAPSLPPFHPLDTKRPAGKPYTKPTSWMDGGLCRRTIKLCTNTLTVVIRNFIIPPSTRGILLQDANAVWLHHNSESVHSCSYVTQLQSVLLSQRSRKERTFFFFFETLYREQQNAEHSVSLTEIHFIWEHNSEPKQMMKMRKCNTRFSFLTQ
jgi:hypothetical protein